MCIVLFWFGCARSSDTKTKTMRGARNWIEALEHRTLFTSAFVPQPPIGQYTPTPFPEGISATQIREAYSVDGIRFGAVSGNGLGQTIAIVDSYDDPYALSDLREFDRQFGLPDPPHFEKLNEYGGTSLPPEPAQKREHHGTFEESIDVQWAHAIAPEANIVLIETKSPSDVDELTHGIRTAARLPGVVAVSISAAGPEFSGETNYDQDFQTPSGHPGVTFLAATGDYGAYGAPNTTVFHAGYPAVSPNVVAVGGTVLTTDAAGNTTVENGWNESGGGISDFEPEPSFQSNFAALGTSQRSVPDVAMNAVDFPICDTYDDGSATPWAEASGTSISCPMWAGLIAIADQGRSAVGLPPLDGPSQTLPALYQLPASDFRDISTGNNGYAAGPGYDLVTGRGSPVADLLVPDLAFGAGPFTVTNSNDMGPGSLRQAIEEVDHTARPATITFAIPKTGSNYNNGVFTIRSPHALPLITRSGVTLDGSTQAGGVIVIAGRASKGLQKELTAASPGVTVKGISFAK